LQPWIAAKADRVGRMLPSVSEWDSSCRRLKPKRRLSRLELRPSTSDVLEHRRSEIVLDLAQDSLDFLERRPGFGIETPAIFDQIAQRQRITPVVQVAGRITVVLPVLEVDGRKRAERLLSRHALVNHRADVVDLRFQTIFRTFEDLCSKRASVSVLSR